MNKPKNVIMIALIPLLVLGWLVFNELYPFTGWTLFVYKRTHTPSSQIQQIDGYDSKEECMKDGHSFAVLTLDEVFECGYRCRGDFAHTCKIVCNESNQCSKFR